MIPPCVKPQGSQAMRIHRQKQGPFLFFCLSQCWCKTLLKQDISLFTGAHLSKVMACKIWVSLKGNRDDKAIIHFSSYRHCHHSLDRLRERVTSLLLSQTGYGPNEGKAIIKTSFRDVASVACTWHVDSMSIPTIAPIIIISSIYGMWNWSLCSNSE